MPNSAQDSNYITLSINARKLLKGGLSALKSISTGDPIGIATAAVEVAEGVGISKVDADLIAQLIEGGLQRVLNDLLSEGQHSQKFSDLKKLSRFKSLSSSAKWPATLERYLTIGVIPQEFKAELLRWMNEISIEQHNANNIILRLDPLFAKALHEEWLSNKPTYESIASFQSSPFSKLSRADREWERYRIRLISEISSSVFEETFALKDIFVPLRCYHGFGETDRKGLALADASNSDSETRRKMSFLQQTIQEFSSSKSLLTSIVLAGGPGCGKSSSVKMAAAELARQDRKVLFVPLHLIDLQGNFSNSINSYFWETDYFIDIEVVLEGNEDSPVVIFLDGLDEIQMQGRAAQEAARDFVSDALRWLDRRNNQNLRAKLIFTGRDLAVEAVSGVLREGAQIYHLLPYFVDESEFRLFSADDRKKLVDDRHTWWKKYSDLTGRDLDSMPIELAQDELGEVTAQPLLNYLVSLAYFRGKIDLTRISVNDIYGDLLAAIYERVWANAKHAAVQGMEFHVFERLLEEVATTVWHGAGRTATLSEVEEQCRTSRVSNLLEGLELGFSDGLANLLLAFYFRQKGRRDDGQKTFEFTHKSFAEYLTSLAIVRLIKLIVQRSQEHNGDPDSGWDCDEILYRWIKIAGKSAITTDILAFIRREVATIGADELLGGQLVLSKCLSHALICEWPVDRLDRCSFVEKKKRARNAEESLLACLNAFARVTKRNSEVIWSDRTTAGLMLRRLQGQRVGPTNVVGYECLSYMSFINCCFDMGDFYGADLKQSEFMGCDFHYSNFSCGDLEGATFKHCSIVECDFDGTNVTDTKFHDLDLGRSGNFTLARGLRGQKYDKMMLRNMVDRGARFDKVVLDTFSSKKKAN